MDTMKRDRALDALLNARDYLLRVAGDLQLAEKGIPDEDRKLYNGFKSSVDASEIVATLFDIDWLIGQVEDGKLK